VIGKFHDSVVEQESGSVGRLTTTNFLPFDTGRAGQCGRDGETLRSIVATLRAALRRFRGNLPRRFRGASAGALVEILRLQPVRTSDCWKTAAEIDTMVRSDLTDDPVLAASADSPSRTSLTPAYCATSEAAIAEA